ncbi:anti-sigma-D factor RsdA [Amycolatopsis sp. NPDC059657]|uniref:anti-sigma-D factor RsdA n=1 Tax=Amycolatopsis sp. NPDC059657 TaxID=3346899 RepID=UPI0036723EC4
MTDRENRHDWYGSEPEFELPPFPLGMTASEAEFAADLSAVQADDALLDALGGSDPKVADGLGDQELNALLLAWRRDIDSEPLADLVDTDTAITTVKTAALAKKYGQRGARRRTLVPVAAAAAVLAILFTGTGLAAKDARPGDTLWGLTKVLYADHARSIEAAAAARLDLERANLALAGGRLDDARKALDDAKAALRQVSPDDNLDQLMDQHRQLSAQLANPTGANPPPATTTSGPGSPSSITSVPQQPTTSVIPPGTGDGSTKPTPTSSSSPSPTPTPTTSTTQSGTANVPGTSPRYEVPDSSDTTTTTTSATP